MTLIIESVRPMPIASVIISTKRKPRRAQQRATTISDILQCSLDSVSKPHLSNFLFDLFDAAGFYKRLPVCFIAGHALKDLCDAAASSI